MQMITIKLPDKVYEQLRRAADILQRPVEDVIAQSLTHTLPPLLDDIPSDYQEGVFPLLEMSDEDLRNEIGRTLSIDTWAEYEALLQREKAQVLAPAEQSRLEELRYEADLLTLRRGYAAVLLKRSGQSIPDLEQLPSVS